MSQKKTEVKVPLMNCFRIDKSVPIKNAQFQCMSKTLHVKIVLTPQAKNFISNTRRRKKRVSQTNECTVFVEFDYITLQKGKKVLTRPNFHMI